MRDGAARARASVASPGACRFGRPLVLETENTPVSDVYLLEAGLASIVARFPGGRDIEVGIVGREGMTGDAVVLGGFPIGEPAADRHSQPAGTDRRGARIRSAEEEYRRLIGRHLAR